MSYALSYIKEYKRLLKHLRRAQKTPVEERTEKENNRIELLQYRIDKKEKGLTGAMKFSQVFEF